MLPIAATTSGILEFLQNPVALLNAIYLYFAWQVWSVISPNLVGIFQLFFQHCKKRIITEMLLSDITLVSTILHYFYKHNRNGNRFERVHGTDAWLLAPGNHLLTIDGKWVYVRHVCTPMNNGLPPKRVIYLSTFFGNTKFLNAWITTVMSSKKKGEMFLSSSNYWRQAKMTPRSLDTVVLRDGLKEQIVRDIDDFVAREERYASLDIPYRRVYLLSSMPGMGKTSLITAIATYTDAALYSMSLSGNMTDEMFFKMVGDMKENSILVLEDIDAMFGERMPVAGTSIPQSSGRQSKVTLSGILNILDGIATPHGLIVVMTTNYPDRLDSALVREERVHKHWKLDTHPELVGKMFLRFHPTQMDLAHEFAQLVPPDTNMAKLQGYLITHLDDAKSAIQHANDYFGYQHSHGDTHDNKRVNNDTLSVTKTKDD